jgi:hypothetical protein
MTSAQREAGWYPNPSDKSGQIDCYGGQWPADRVWPARLANSSLDSTDYLQGCLDGVRDHPAV